MLATAIAMVFWLALFLAALGLLRRSWIELVVAALLSLAFGIATIFSIGIFGLALFALDMAAAVALRRKVGWIGWILAIASAILVAACPIALPRVAPDVQVVRVASVAVPLVGLALAVLLLIRAGSRPAPALGEGIGRGSSSV